MSPTFLHSASEFQAAVQLGDTPESLVLEFKETLNDWNPPAADPKRQERRREAQKEMCRDISQFANTLGGCLLLGVSERLDSTRGVKVADSITPIQEVEQLRQWIEQAIMNYLVPTTFTHDVVAITLPQGNILAVNVPASRYLVSLWDRANHTVEYVRRISHGKDWMNPGEVERHLMDGSRAAKLALIAAKEQATSEQVEIADGIWQQSSGKTRNWHPPPSKLPITISHMSEYWFELRMNLPPFGDVSVTVPYSLIKETWVNSSGRVMLLLTVRIVEREGELVLTPSV